MPSYVTRFCKVSYLLIIVTMPLMAATSRIYVLNRNANTIDVIDPVINKVVQTIKGPNAPNGVIFSPNGRRAYVTSESDDHTLTVIDTETGKIIKKVPLSGFANIPTISKDGGRVFVC